MEMLRALRLVIDTGIHYYGWDFKKSFNYMKKYSELGEKEMENEIEIGELDIEESPNSATSLNCRGVPLFVKFKNGQQISQKVGWPGKEQLKEWIKENS